MKRVWLKRAAIAAAMTGTFVVGHWTGISDGFETGYKAAYMEMDNLLREGMRGGVKFSIQGLRPKFVPRQPERYEIAGAGADTPVLREQ